MDYEYLLNWILDILVILGSVLFVAFFFGMCIFVHELGHFLVARWRGLHVDAFSIGFKAIWKKKINGVEYRIGCLPLGGYVELPQVDSATETPKAADGTELPKAKPLDRLLTAAAGPICNIIFGLLLGCIVWAVGIPQDTPKMRSIEVAAIDETSPEYEAGLRVGDRIAAVDGTPVSGEDGKSYNDAVNFIRGEQDTWIQLTIVRDGEALDISVLPGDVSISYISYQILEGNIGYINISQFTGDAASGFQKALETFKAQHVAGLVIDVRNNPGGLLDQVVSICDSLLPTGVIVYIQERDGSREYFYSDEEAYDVPLAVLVNGRSASASEILASAVQALGRGTVVGLNTYGKGIVQSLINFKEDGAGMQLTTSSYYDARDRSPQGVGVAPDVEVALEGNAIPLEPDPTSDNQLAAAIADINRQIAGLTPR